MMLQIALADQDLFLIVRSLNNDPSKGIAEKRSAPELQAFALSAIAANVAVLVADAIDHGDKNAIGDRMCALNGTPGVMLHGAELGFLVRMPADGGGIKENICALQRGQARAFGIPLVPADERSHAAILGVKCLEAEVAGREIELLVIKRIVRDVHLAIEALGAAIGVKNDGGVVIETARASLKDRNHDRSFGFAGDSARALRRRSGNRLSQVEECSVFTLAEILRAKKLRQADDLRALLGGGADLSTARRRLSSGSAEQCIWMRPTVNMSGLGISYLDELPRIPKLPKIAEIEKPLQSSAVCNLVIWQFWQLKDQFKNIINAPV